MARWYICWLAIGVCSAGVVFWHSDSAASDDAQTAALVGQAEADANAGKYAQALSEYRQAAAQGAVRAETAIGAIYATLVDFQLAARWYGQAARAGDPVAQEALARLYETGQGVTKDVVCAMTWYLSAADQGLAAAQDAVGRLYETGDGTPRDYAAAWLWYSRAAAQNFAHGQFDLGRLEETGKGTESGRAPNKALQEFRLAAAQNDSDALNKLGDVYQNGTDGQAQNAATAYDYYWQAANAPSNPNANAEDVVALHFLKRSPPSYSQAALWFKRAVKQGNVDAEDRLGHLYDKGEGVTKDPDKAEALFRNAALAGNADAKEWFATRAPL